ncbi:MAG: WbuC family cupin fold metalloprotein [Candidatus Omnitrophota bacterium]|nr:WbuC family cupin fold metalloprotein [Candidatus Omnitrophota bacterium]
MVYKKINDEVLYSDEQIVTVSASDLAFLKEAATHNVRKRIRLCTHTGVNDKVHEMFIVHMKGAYVRPHKILGKSESFQVLEGEVDVILYADDGRLTRVIKMGDMASDKAFYYRLPESVFHTLRVRSEVVCFKEVTLGPFISNGTIFAPWSPDQNDLSGVAKFLEKLNEA